MPGPHHLSSTQTRSLSSKLGSKLEPWASSIFLFASLALAASLADKMGSASLYTTPILATFTIAYSLILHSQAHISSLSPTDSRTAQIDEQLTRTLTRAFGASLFVWWSAPLMVFSYMWGMAGKPQITTTIFWCDWGASGCMFGLLGVYLLATAGEYDEREAQGELLGPGAIGTLEYGTFKS